MKARRTPGIHHAGVPAYVDHRAVSISCQTPTRRDAREVRVQGPVTAGLPQVAVLFPAEDPSGYVASILRRRATLRKPPQPHPNFRGCDTVLTLLGRLPHPWQSIPGYPRSDDAIEVLPADGVEGRAGHVSRVRVAAELIAPPSMPAGPARLSPLPTIIPAEIVPVEALRPASRTPHFHYLHHRPLGPPQPIP